MITRKINWVSGIKTEHQHAITLLDQKLSSFYAGNKNYYGDINFTADNWIDENEEGYKTIVKEVNKAAKVCEFGCGSANILKHHAHLQDKYYGCDFSEQLIRSNQLNYPRAHFVQFATANKLPFENETFDVVFSTFVIEHSTNPAALLLECKRILKPGGKLMILCPDFMGAGRMSSQRSGFSKGNSTQKIKKGKYFDALITLFDNRIRLPLYCFYLKSIAFKSPSFFININPTVFEDEFTPDVDAVYVTYKKEMISFLKKDFTIIQNSPNEIYYEKSKKLIFLNCIKNKIKSD